MSSPQRGICGLVAIALSHARVRMDAAAQHMSAFAMRNAIGTAQPESAAAKQCAFAGVKARHMPDLAPLDVFWPGSSDRTRASSSRTGGVAPVRSVGSVEGHRMAGNLL